MKLKSGFLAGKTWLINHWGLLALFCIWLLLFVTNFKQGLNVLGWDNFSVSLDLHQNFWRTLFSTWREYRGLGVPSDSEVVDVFRQIVLLLLSLPFGRLSLDSLFYLISLGVGIAGIYYLSRQVVSQASFKFNHFIVEAAAFVSALLYLFNFHSYELFQFPVAMYVIRYALFPWGIWIFIKLIQSKKTSIKNYLVFMVIALLLSGSYLTATVFFTFLIILGFIILSFHNKLTKSLKVLGLLIMINAFWLLPFANYYLEKAELIPKASTFVEVNEALLNKPAHNFSLEKIIAFYPETITKEALPFRNLSTNEPVSITETNIADYRQDSAHLFREIIIFILIGFGVGVILIEVIKKRKIHHLWILLLILAMLVVLRKNNPPFGFLYEILDEFIPFFSIIFRFGGAKFYPLLLIGITQALALGVAAVLLIADKVNLILLKKTYQLVFVSLIAAVLVFPFISLFRGHLFNRIVTTKVPEAYQEVANLIDQHEKDGRVLHLPTDDYSYWKSYTWGYFGSSFFHIYLDKPLLDRTFEPASVETDNFFVALERITTNTQALDNTSLEMRARELSVLLQKTNTSFIIFDESVSPELPNQNLHAWGVFRTADYKRLLEKMELLSLIEKIGTHEIEYGTSSNTDELIVYEVVGNQQKVTSLIEVMNVDPAIENTFISPLLKSKQQFMQTIALPYRTYPFWQPRKNVIHSDTTITVEQQLQLSETNADSRLFIDANNSELDQVIATLYISRNSEQEIEIYSYESVLPKTQQDLHSLMPVVTIPSSEFENENEAFLLQVGESVVKLPDIESLTSEQMYLATMMVDIPSYTIKLLKSEDSTVMSNEYFSLTDNPNCFEDGSDNYEFNYSTSSDSFGVDTVGGMTCLSAPLVSSFDAEQLADSVEKYYEVNLYFSSTTSQTSKQDAFQLPDVSKLQANVRKEISSYHPYTQIGMCLMDISNGDCLNTNYFILGNQSRSISLLTDRPTSETHSQLLITIPSSDEYRHSFNVSDAEFREYTSIFSASVATKFNAIPEPQSIAISDSKLELTLPKITSASSYNFDPGVSALDYSSRPCPIENGSRHLMANTEGFYSFQENCFQNIWMRVPYDSSSLYLWQVKYHVFSGKQPQFILRSTSQLKREFISRFNIYPFFTDFKSLQKADRPWWRTSDYQKYIQNELTNATYIDEHTTIYPLGDFANNSSLSYELYHGNEGQGLVGVQEMNVWQYPGYWQNLAIETGNITSQFDKVDITTVKRILPSLWRAEISKPTDKQHGQVFIAFDQAYDRQWEAFQTNSWLLALLGMGKIDAQHVKSNGWANGWIIDTTEFSSDSNTTIYFFYTPEKLAVLGWLVTGLSTTGLTALLVYQKRRRKL